MSEIFEKAFEWILEAEGGYVNHSKDPGGETNMGISKRVYPNINIKNLTIAQAKEIYFKNYWEVCKCNFIPYKLAVSVFDCAVNQGPITAIKLLQQSCNVTIDGIIGSKTLSAVYSNPFVEFMLLRAFQYANTKNFDVFGKGWKKRLLDLTKFLELKVG